MNKATLDQEKENLSEILKRTAFVFMLSKYRPPIIARNGNCRMTTFSC